MQMGMHAPYAWPGHWCASQVELWLRSPEDLQLADIHIVKGEDILMFVSRKFNEEDLLAIVGEAGWQRQVFAMTDRSACMLMHAAHDFAESTHEGSSIAMSLSQYRKSGMA